VLSFTILVNYCRYISFIIINKYAQQKKRGGPAYVNYTQEADQEPNANTETVCRKIIEVVSHIHQLHHVSFVPHRNIKEPRAPSSSNKRKPRQPARSGYAFFLLFSNTSTHTLYRLLQIHTNVHDTTLIMHTHANDSTRSRMCIDLHTIHYTGQLLHRRKKHCGTCLLCFFLL